MKFENVAALIEALGPEAGAMGFHWRDPSGGFNIAFQRNKIFELMFIFIFTTNHQVQFVNKNQCFV